MIARLGAISNVSTEQHELNKSQSVRESKESHPGEHPRRDVFSLSVETVALSSTNHRVKMACGYLWEETRFSNPLRHISLEAEPHDKQL